MKDIMTLLFLFSLKRNDVLLASSRLETRADRIGAPRQTKCADPSVCDRQSNEECGQFDRNG